MRTCLLLWLVCSPFLPLYAGDGDKTAADQDKLAETAKLSPLEQLEARARRLQDELAALTSERAQIVAALEEQAARARIEALFRAAEEAAEAGEREEAEALRRQALAVQEAQLRALYSGAQAGAGAPRTPPSATPIRSPESDWERHYWNEAAAAAESPPAPRLPEAVAPEGESPEATPVPTGEKNAPQGRIAKKKAQRKKAQRKVGQRKVGQRNRTRKTPPRDRRHREDPRHRGSRPFSADDVVRDRMATVDAILRILNRPAGTPATPSRPGPSLAELAKMRKVLRQLRTQLDGLDKRLGTFEKR